MMEAEKRPVWLTSFWGFEPQAWGCIGFSDLWRRENFLSDAKKGALVAIYVTKGRGADTQRGKVVGILEASGEVGHIKNFMSGDEFEVKEANPETRGKWEYAVRVTRAWEIDEADWARVEDIFPHTYKSSAAQTIGANGVKLTSDEVTKLDTLTVREVPVYGQNRKIDSVVRPFSDALKPSKAVFPAKEPYFVGEVDGPKHLYILKLLGGAKEWLGHPSDTESDKLIVKVGFSKSPYMRRNQIQSAYPHGRFKWEIFRPAEVPDMPPYENAAVAIKGEDAMKARLIKGGATSLGGEFYLADEWLVLKSWTAGNLAAENAQKNTLGTK